MVIRFSEYEYYNINHDEDWVRFMATVDKGSYYCEVPRVSSQVFRENRQKFKEAVIECLENSIDPCEVTIEDATLH